MLYASSRIPLILCMLLPRIVTIVVDSIDISHDGRTVSTKWGQ